MEYAMNENENIANKNITPIKSNQGIKNNNTSTNKTQFPVLMDSQIQI